MSGPNGNSNGWRPWVMGVLVVGLAGALGLLVNWNSTRIERLDSRIDRLEGIIFDIGKDRDNRTVILENIHRRLADLETATTGRPAR